MTSETIVKKPPKENPHNIGDLWLYEYGGLCIYFLISRLAPIFDIKDPGKYSIYGYMLPFGNVKPAWIPPGENLLTINHSKDSTKWKRIV